MLDHLLYLTTEDIRAACADLDTVAVMRDVLTRHATGETILADESYLSWSPPAAPACSGGATTRASSETARSLGMPGLVRGPRPVVGTKIINANSANAQAGLPRASGVTLLFDLQTARPVCILEAAYISAMRTASVTVLAADLVQSLPIATAALIGAGGQANSHLQLFMSHLLDLKEVRIFDHEPERANVLHNRHEAAAHARGVALTLATNARAAIAGAELVATVTTTTTGYIPFNWLSPGTTLVSVSLDDLLPDVVARTDILIVDDWRLISSDSRRLLGRLYRQGLVCGPEMAPAAGVRKVDATLGDLLLGRHPGRRDPDEIVLVNPFGLAIEDLALAQLVYEFATSAGLGRQLPFDG
jgi:N-[(2S)-2-amino-2-carboxyethyl]-L-glutamate dehydrogenase